MTAARTPGARSRWLVPLAFLAFVSLGLPDGLLGVAWPSLRRSYAKPVDALGLILLAMMTGYLASSFSAGSLVRRLGVGRLLVASGLVVAGGATLWALAPPWPIVVGAGLLLGAGAGAIDAGVNGFAAVHFSPRVTTWLHAAWGLGATTGPLAMTATLAAGLGWRVGYAELALGLVVLAIFFRLTLPLWDGPAGASAGARATLREALKSSRVRTNALLFFVYTGIEAGAGQWAYSFLTEARGLGAPGAGLAASAYWGSILAGRIAFGAAAHHLAPRLLLRAVTCAAPFAALLLCVTRGPWLGCAALVVLGLLLAPVFPLSIAETPSRVGERHAAHAIGFQISAATLGSGTLPALAGVLMRGVGLEALGPYLLLTTLLLLLVDERLLRLRDAQGR